MSNLKKVVSLVLVVVMVFAMGASAMAAFSDADDINFTDEVNLLTALGVIGGYPDGSFKPLGSVTRAEFAKMLFMVKLGHLDSAGFVNAATTFTDLEAAAWAKGFIKYLNSVGVIAGKSATSFDPNGQVTGYEAVKMLLVALGYKADQAGLVGEKWKINTLALGQDRGVLDGYNQDFDAPATRELASLLIANALDAVCVKYSGLSLDASGNLTADVVDETRTTGGSTVNVTLGYKAFGLYYETGIVVGTKNLALLQTAPATYYGNSSSKAFNLKATGGTSEIVKNQVAQIKFDSFDEALIGQEVVVAYRIANNGDRVAYGVTATGKSKVYTSKLVDTKAAYTSAPAFDKLTTKIDGSTKDFKKFETLTAAQAIYFGNDGKVNNAYVDLKTFFKDEAAVEFDASPIFGGNIKLPGSVTLIDSDDDGEIDYAYVLASTFGRVDTYNAADKKFTMLGTSVVEFKDDDFKKVSGEFKAGDYVFAAPKFDGGIVVAPAEKLNIKVTKTTSDKIYVGDTAYYGYLTSVKPTDFSFNSVYTVYTDGAFIARRAIDSTETVSVDNIALATYINTDLKLVKLLNSKGDEDIYSYTNGNSDAVIGEAITAIAEGGANDVPMLVKTSFNDAGRVKLSLIGTGDSAVVGGAHTLYADSDKTITYQGTSGKFYLDDNSKIFVAKGTTAKVFSKAGIKGYTQADAVDTNKAAAYGDTDRAALVYRTTSSGYRYVVAAYILVKGTATLPSGVSTDKYVFLTSDPSSWKTSDGNFFQITGQCDGAAVAYTSDKGLTIATSIKKYSWVKVSLNADGEVKANVDAAIGGIGFADGLFTYVKGIDANNDGDYADIGETAPVNDGKMIIGAIKGYDAGYKTVTLFAHDATEDVNPATDGKELETLKVDSDTKYYVMGANGTMTAGSISDLMTADYGADDYYTNCFFKAKADGVAEIIVIIATNRASSIKSDFQWNLA